MASNKMAKTSCPSPSTMELPGNLRHHCLLPYPDMASNSGEGSLVHRESGKNLGSATRSIILEKARSWKRGSPKLVVPKLCAHSRLTGVMRHLVLIFQEAIKLRKGEWNFRRHCMENWKVRIFEFEILSSKRFVVYFFSFFHAEL